MVQGVDKRKKTKLKKTKLKKDRGRQTEKLRRDGKKEAATGLLRSTSHMISQSKFRLESTAILVVIACHITTAAPV